MNPSVKTMNTLGAMAFFLTPDLPVNLHDQILATTGKLPSFCPINKPKHIRRQHFEALIQVLPRSIAPSGFCSAFLSLARSHPWAAYAALCRMANKYWMPTDTPFIKQVIHDLEPVLKSPDVCMPRFDLDSLDYPSDEFSPPAWADCPTEPPDNELTLACALAVSLGASGRWHALAWLLARPWLAQPSVCESLLHHFLRHGDDEGLDWWTDESLPVPDSFAVALVLHAAADGHAQSLAWIAERAHELGRDLCPGLAQFDLITAGIKSGWPHVMDEIWAAVGGDGIDGFDFGDRHWEMASTLAYTELGGGKVNVRMLEWARNKGIAYPEPEDMFECLEAAGVQVLQWWLENYLRHVPEKDQVGYATDAFDFAAEKDDVERMDWWIKSGLEVRFSPNAVSEASGKPELEAWWDKCLQYKLLSGALFVESAAELGIVPCRHFETLCSWGRLDLLEPLDIDRLAHDSVGSDVVYRGIFAACRYGHVAILDRYRHLIDGWMDEEDVQTCTHDAVANSQVGVLDWLLENGYSSSFTQDWWHSVALEVVSYQCGPKLAEVVGWVCRNGRLALPASSKLVLAGIEGAKDPFPVVYQLWKHGGLGVYSFRLTELLIEVVLGAGCKEMIDWWLDKQSDILHDLHREVLLEAAERLGIAGCL